MTDKLLMSARARTLLAGSLAAVAVLCSPLAAYPASMPVFRHALEQSSVSDYEVIVFHRGEMSTDAHALVESLESARARSSVNVLLRTVDVAAQMDKSMEELWTGQNDPQPPWMVVRAPETSPDAAPVWTGQLTATVVSSLLDSPARRKITEGLLSGATAVWVLLECGEAARDEAAVDVLSSALKTLERKLTLPSPGALRSPLPLHVDFELVRVTRSDPAEEFFVTLLEHGKPVFSSRPVAFPVFGRGRTLGALVGREIDLEGISSVCAMLTGAVREGTESTPGRDLLLAADWKKVFDPSMAVPSAKPAASRAEAVVPPVVAAASDAPANGLSSWLMILPVIVVGAGLAFVLTRKPRSSG